MLCRGASTPSFDLTIEERALALVAITPGHYKPPDHVLAFLEAL